MKKLNHLIILSLSLAVALSALSCGGRRTVKEGELSGDLSLSGAFALYPLAVQWADAFERLHPAVHIDISAGGAGKGMTDVLAGVVDLGMVSREVYPPEKEKGAVVFAVAKDAVAPTINTANPKAAELLNHGLTQEMARRIWVMETTQTWGKVLGTTDDTPIHVYTRSDACGAADTWASWLDAKQEDLCGTAVFGDPGVAAAIQKDPLGVGFNNLGYIYDSDTNLPHKGLSILPIDTNGDGKLSSEELFYDTKQTFIAAIADGKYPSPPARDLYLVTKGVPTNPLIVAFLKFVLTEGQQANAPAGYITISKSRIEAQLKQLESAK